MNRRNFLVTATLTPWIIVAGCTSDEEPGTGPPGEAVTDPIRTEYLGDEDERIEDIDIELDGAVGFVIIHDGSNAFSVDIIPTENSEDQSKTLTEEAGYAGANLQDISVGTYDLIIESNESWVVEIVQHPVYTADMISPEFPAETTGQTDDFFGPVNMTQDLSMSVTAEGEGANRVDIRNSTGTLVDTPIEGTGPLEETAGIVIEDDIGWIDVQMSGGYELTVTD